MKTRIALVAAAATAVISLPASAALTDAQKCETTYLKAAGKRITCILKAREKAVKKGTPPDFTKCEDKFNATIMKIEDKLGVACPPRTWFGATARFIDNGDGTLTDQATGLTWELKLGDGGSADVDNTHPWAGSCSGGAGFCQPSADASALCPMDGDGMPDLGCDVCPGAQTCNVTDGQGGSETIFSYVDSLNDSSLGGRTDWRVPTKGELATLLAEPAICSFDPCIDDTFNQGPTSFTASAGYWTATTEPKIPQVASNISFFSGNIVTVIKSAPQRIRAVAGP